jgi:hypothetical protein
MGYHLIKIERRKGMRNQIKTVLVVLVAMAAGTAMAANGVQVNAAAAMDGTNYGMEVVIEDNATSTYVVSEHASDEKVFRALFWINPANLANVSAVPGTTWFRFFAAADDSLGQHIVLFLKKSVQQRNWRVTVYKKQNNGFFVFAGEFFWCSGAAPAPFQMQVEWTAADVGMNNGMVSVTKLADGTGITFSSANDSNFEVDKVFAGFLNFDSFDPGAGGGSYYFDEYESYRTLAP